MVVLVAILIILAKLIRFLKRSPPNISNQTQEIYTINNNDGILDYNQALSCSIEIKKDNNEFKEEKLPTYQDALKSKPTE
jgi:hypothetical protein